jgi:hypothetical protein
MKMFTNEIVKNYKTGILKDISCEFDWKINNSHSIVAVGWGNDP